MRDYSLTYIPDLTERFPEGFDGVDRTPGRYIDPWELLDRLDMMDDIPDEEEDG